MKEKFALGLASLAMVLSATVAFAAKDTSLSFVEAEDITTEASWGLVVSEITTSTTAYGGILSDGDARMVTFPRADNPAEYTFEWSHGSAQTLVIRHLDGFADDSFMVEAYRDPGYGKGDDKNEKDWWVYVGTYNDQHSTEEWVTTPFDLTGHGHWAKGTGEMKVRITLLDELHETWSPWTTFGQLAIDWMELRGNGK